MLRFVQQRHQHKLYAQYTMSSSTMNIKHKKNYREMDMGYEYEYGNFVEIEINLKTLK